MLPVLFFQQFADVNVKIWHVLAIAIVVYILVKIKTAIGTKNLILLGGTILSSLCLIFVDTDSQKATIDQKSIEQYGKAVKFINSNRNCSLQAFLVKYKEKNYPPLEEVLTVIEAERLNNAEGLFKKFPYSQVNFPHYVPSEEKLIADNNVANIIKFVFAIMSLVFLSLFVILDPHKN